MDKIVFQGIYYYEMWYVKLFGYICTLKVQFYEENMYFLSLLLDSVFLGILWSKG